MFKLAGNDLGVDEMEDLLAIESENARGVQFVQIKMNRLS
jgi:hypothetical protein